MYFPNAFKKVFIGKTALAGSPPVQTLTPATTGTTADLTTGQIGLFDAKTYAAITAAPGSGNQPFILAQGSYHTVDKIGPYHGGYKESIKSKIINPKYVSRFFKVAAKTAQNQIIRLNEGLDFVCGTTYTLRVDVKGSPALRFLSHNLYRSFDFFTGCCADNCTTPCNGDPVDGALVMQGWADQINGDAIFNKFVRATPVVNVTSQAATGTSGATAIELSAANAGVLVDQYVFGTGVAPGAKITVKNVNGTTLTVDKANVGAVSGTLTFSKTVDGTYTPVVYDGTNATAVNAVNAALLIETAYADTTFGNCTFTTTDKYDLEPLFVYLSITDDTGNPCATYPIANTSDGNGVTQLQAPRQASGVGETVLRDLILSQRYLQEPFPDGNSIDQLRLREVLDDQSMAVVNRSSLYDKIYILHNVPRLNNSTSIFDNDQYLLEIDVPTGTNTAPFTTLVQAMLDLAGNGIALETF